MLKSRCPNNEALLAERLHAGQSLLFFDGVCVLCSGFAQYVLKHDHHKRIMICTAQSALGQAAYQQHGLDHRDFKTNLLLSRGRVFSKSEAFIETMWQLGGVNAIFVMLRVVPRQLRDLIYDPIARNRYRWFGVRQQCFVPQPEFADRFLT
jgi:predicted DCC family thiol-disulfide oxidoreductase YuxK